jgi:hypothetical protein
MDAAQARRGAAMMERIFDLTLLADQSLVQAAWVLPEDLLHLPAAVEVLKTGSVGRAPLMGRELQWNAQPGQAISTMRVEGRVTLLSIALAGEGGELLELWIASLRAMPSIRLVNANEAHAFEIIRRVRERPLSASVLLPEGSREEQKELLDLQRSVSFALLSAQW